jgi:uncharacterized protein with PCYCGC motif
MTELRELGIYPIRAPRRMVRSGREIETGHMATENRSSRVQPIAIGLTVVFILAACGASASPPVSWSAVSPAPTKTAAPVSQNPVAVAAWQVRPDFVREDARTEEAYAFALAHPDVLKWIPCYCGCAAMGHGSNLDCFVIPGDGKSLRFEEHASYCEVCVNEALMAKQMLADGKSMLEIRLAIDAQFGNNGAPGTDTDMPSA